MADAAPRRLLVESVTSAALMQVATIGDGGFPALCHVWFQPAFEPDRLCFLSREDREHAINIRNDPRVAASIALEVPAGLGERVRGVTLTGLAREIPEDEMPEAASAFISRWPRAADQLTAARSTRDPVTRSAGFAGSATSRLYEIAVAGWVLFDEVNFPAHPRVCVPAY